MQVVKIEDISDLQIYCEKCRDLGWINNSSLERLNIDMVIKNQGAYFGIYENPYKNQGFYVIFVA